MKTLNWTIFELGNSIKIFFVKETKKKISQFSNNIMFCFSGRVSIMRECLLDRSNFQISTIAIYTLHWNITKERKVYKYTFSGVLYEDVPQNPITSMNNAILIICLFIYHKIHISKSVSSSSYFNFTIHFLIILFTYSNVYHIFLN